MSAIRLISVSVVGRFFAIALLLVSALSCASVQEIRMDGLCFEIPKNHQFRWVEQTNKNIQQVYVSSSQSYVLVMVSKEEMNAEAMLARMREMAPHMSDAIFANMSMGDGKQVDYNGIKAVAADVESSVLGQAAEGRIIVATTNKRTTTIIALWGDKEQEKNVERILASVKFIDTDGYGELSIEDRMAEFVRSLDEKLPQTIEKGLLYLSVRSGNDSVVHSYQFLEELNVRISEKPAVCSLLKEAQIDELNELDGAMMREWFDAKKVFQYVFYQPDGSEAFSFVISKEDKLKRQLEELCLAQ